MTNTASLPRDIAQKYVQDSLRSLVSGMGDPRQDKLATTFYAETFLDDAALLSAYKSSWIARKIVNIPAMDSLRKGRDWQADEKDIRLIEAEERRLKFWPKMVELEIKARLFGGAAMIIGGGNSADNYAEPFNPETVKKGGLTHLTVLTRRELTAQQLQDDAMDEYFGEPMGYDITGRGSDLLNIHPSRIVRRVGNPHPDPWNVVTSTSTGWGDSVLLNVYEQMRQADSTFANVASLVFEANVDVFGIPDLMENVSEKDYRDRLYEKMTLNNLGKSINRSMMRDKDEDYDRHTINFSGLPDLMEKFMLAVSGAADIPLTRFLGQSPSGLSSTGEGDMKNYYDRVTSIQELEIQPSLVKLDDAIIVSALGKRDLDIHYNWSPLELINEKEESEIAKNDAVVAETYHRMGIFSPDELRDSVSSKLIENGYYPALGDAMSKTGDVNFGFEFNAEETPPATLPPGVVGAPVNDATPRSLYIKREVLNPEPIVEWAKSQGLENILDGDDMHVTIAYSRKPVDWFKVGEAWDEELKIREGGPRQIEQFGDATVLLVANRMLNWRHEDIIREGATWDHPEYQPHVTIAYNSGVKVENIEPYRGVIELGSEIFEEIDEDWKSRVTGA